MPAWAEELAHLDALNEPALATDRTGRVVFGNTAAAWRHGALGEEGWANLSSVILPEGDQGVLSEVIEQAVHGVSWQGRLDVRHVDGSVQPAEVSCTPLRRDNEIVGSLWIVDYAVGEWEQVREIRRLGDRLRRLSRVAASLNTADMQGNTANAAFTWGVVVNPKDGLAYVNDFNNGLWIVRIEPKASVVP